MTAHEISIVSPIYNRHLRQAICSCSWTSDELPSGGKATLAGLEHVHAADPSTTETHPETRQDSAGAGTGQGAS